MEKQDRTLRHFLHIGRINPVTFVFYENLFLDLCEGAWNVLNIHILTKIIHLCIHLWHILQIQGHHKNRKIKFFLYFVWDYGHQIAVTQQFATETQSRLCG